MKRFIGPLVAGLLASIADAWVGLLAGLACIVGSLDRRKR